VCQAKFFLQNVHEIKIGALSRRIQGHANSELCPVSFHVQLRHRSLNSARHSRESRAHLDLGDRGIDHQSFHNGLMIRYATQSVSPPKEEVTLKNPDPTVRSREAPGDVAVCFCRKTKDSFVINALFITVGMPVS